MINVMEELCHTSGFLWGVLHGGVPGQSRRGQEVASSRQEIGKSTLKHVGNRRRNENIGRHKNDRGFQAFLVKTKEREDGGTAPPEAEEALLKQVLDAAGKMKMMMMMMTSC